MRNAKCATQKCYHCISKRPAFNYLDIRQFKNIEQEPNEFELRNSIKASSKRYNQANQTDEQRQMRY